MTKRLATPEEALRLIHYEAWCEKHSSPEGIACKALLGDLWIDVRRVDGGPEEAVHHCTDCTS